MIITDAAIKNRAVVAMFVLLTVIMGVYSYIVLPREAAPDVPIPIILVTTSYEGVSPVDIESSITIKLENELTGLKGLKEVRSSSAEGRSTVVVEFTPDVKIEEAVRQVRDSVDKAKGDLPRDADDPVIKEINVAEFPVVYVSVLGDISVVRLKAIADELDDAIKQVPGVLDTEITGDLEPEVRVEVNPDRLEAFNITVNDILSLIPSENVNVSAGGLETPLTKFNVRIPQEFVEPGEVDKLIVAIKDGHPIYLSDVALAVYTFKDRMSYSRVNGEDTVTIAIKKRIGANLVFMSDAIHYIVNEANKKVPAGVKVEVTDDQAKYIRLMIADLENSMFSGLVLVLVVLFFFLGLRTAGIVAIAIPLSMLMSFMVIRFLGYTLNMIVLASLVISLGMLVDNAIVIVENIYRHVQLGYSRWDAAIMGAREVAWPVTTSTATTLAAFAPLLFWQGVIGEFMKYMPITLIIVLSCSLFVALVISPVVCSMAAHAEKKSDTVHPVIRVYRSILKAAIYRPAPTIILAFFFLVILTSAYTRWGHGTVFFPEMDPDRGDISVRLPQGANIHETDRICRIIEERLVPFREHFKYVIANVGTSGGFVGALGPHLASIRLVFLDYNDRTTTSAEIVTHVRKALEGIAGAEITVSEEKEGPPTGAPITVRIVGKDLKRLGELNDKAYDLIKDVPGLINLRSDLELARPEIAFRVDRSRAMLLGVNSFLIGNYLKTAVLGNKVGSYRPPDNNNEYDITVRFPLEKREDVENLLRIQIPNRDGASVPLSSLGFFDYRGGYGTINRVGQKRVVTLTADSEGRRDEEVLADVQKRRAGLTGESGDEFRYAGEK